MFQTEFLSLFLYFTGTAFAFAIAAWLSWRGRRSVPSPGKFSSLPSIDVEVYSLCDGQLIDASFTAQRCLDRITKATDDLARLANHLAQRFDDVSVLLADPRETGDLAATSRDGQFQIIREVAGNQVRLEVTSRQTSEPGRRDLHHLDADAQELRMLRANTHAAPFLLWRQTSDGDVIWANDAYLSAATERFGLARVSVWPIPSLFDAIAKTRPGSKGLIKRVQIMEDRSENNGWFDCHMVEIDGEALCTAFPADEAVQSEARRQEFTQTLTKTFSDLAIGLAIFDRSRRLALFNPAVGDLTSLPIDFLTSRPTLVGFLDQLREKRVMPEPRDYRAWRQSITDLESAAMNGTYSETWSLADGQTYRVTGRPHPDGAMALLFEDISAEMSLTRRFRAQLEQSQSIIDSLDEAVAVFSASGELTFSNAAYKDLWDEPAGAANARSSVVEATRRWHELTVPSPIWGDFRDFAFQVAERNEWTAEVTMRDGRTLTCRFVPQKAGASLAIFQPHEAPAKTAGELRRAV